MIAVGIIFMFVALCFVDVALTSPSPTKEYALELAVVTGITGTLLMFADAITA